MLQLGLAESANKNSSVCSKLKPIEKNKNENSTMDQYHMDLSAAFCLKTFYKKGDFQNSFFH